MLHILIVENQFELSSLLQRTLSFELETNIGTSVNARGAVDYLKRTSSIDLIIVRDKIDNENTAKSLVNYIIDHQLSIPVLVLGNLEIAGAKFHTIPIPFSMDQLITKIFNVFRQENISFKEALLPEYLPFSLSYFKIIKVVTCDVYIKMTKAGEDKFLKRIHKNEDLAGHNINQYEINPLINELYVRKENRKDFYNCVLVQALNLIRPSVKGNAKMSFADHAKVYETVQDVIIDFDIEDETIELTNKMTKSMKKAIMASDKIYNIIKHVISNPGSFTYKHSYLTCLFCYEILKRVDFIKDREQIQISFEKLVWVCFFHDIYLKEEKHLKIANKIDFFKAKLTSEEKELVSSHANKAATLIQKFNFAPSGVDIIIKQHHGTTNGIGFTDFYKSNISPMAIIFIVAEEFVVKVLDFKERKQTISQIIEELDIKFELHSYRKVLNALKELLKVKA